MKKITLVIMTTITLITADPCLVAAERMSINADKVRLYTQLGDYRRALTYAERYLNVRIDGRIYCRDGDEEFIKYETTLNKMVDTDITAGKKEFLKKNNEESK